MANQADDFTYAGNGIIRHLTRDDMRRNFEQAFANATYNEFDDLEHPLVQVSPNGKLGWI